MCLEYIISGQNKYDKIRVFTKRFRSKGSVTVSKRRYFIGFVKLLLFRVHTNLVVDNLS